MPKRACPFDDDLLPQLKIHVGQKEVDEGVDGKERMKDVYDKTLDLLKEGVKTLSRKLNTSIDMDPNDIPVARQFSPCKLKHQRSLKQLVLSSKLELMGTDKAIKDARPMYDLCGCSRVVDRGMLTKCSYCDQVLCNNCLSGCASCSELFCQNCSLPVYDSEDRTMCLNCYR